MRYDVHHEDRGGFWNVVFNVVTFVLFGAALCLIVQYLLWGNPTVDTAPVGLIVPTAHVQYQPPVAAPVYVAPAAAPVAPAAPVPPVEILQPTPVAPAPVSSFETLPVHAPVEVETWGEIGGGGGTWDDLAPTAQPTAAPRPTSAWGRMGGEAEAAESWGSLGGGGGSWGEVQE